jgi:Kef-type K+ transport system membrane component KefB
MLVSVAAWAATGHEAPAAEAQGGHGAMALTFFWIAVVLLAAKFSGLVEKLGQPAVLGELVMGVILGNLILVGCDFFEPLKHEPVLLFLSELGVVVLLFQIGLETSIQEMGKVGLKAFLVAIVGVVTPFALGTYLVGPLLLPGLDPNAYLFLGATLTATSVGITARVFKDLGALQTPAARIVLGAAVIDDILGLIILAVVSLIVTTGAASAGVIAWITAKAVLFLVGSFVVGQLLAPLNNVIFSKIHTGTGMKFTLAFSHCLLFAYVASLIDLAPIVGAFAAGLVMTPVHFKQFEDPSIVRECREAAEGDSAVKAKITAILNKHADHHVEHLIEPLGFFLVPIFFIMTGVNVRLETLFDPQILMVALGLTVAAVLGKVVSGVIAGKGNKALVGWGMVPRGEVGLIFAMIGKGLGVVNDSVFSVIIIMVILTTLMTPPILTMVIKRSKP